jgi:hypothetical protein
MKKKIGLIGFGKQLMAAAALMAGGIGQGAEAATSLGAALEQTAPIKEKKDKVIRTARGLEIVRESKRNSHGQRAYAYNKPGFLDQKRKREKLRNNASFGRSKKCTTKR